MLHRSCCWCGFIDFCRFCERFSLNCTMQHEMQYAINKSRLLVAVAPSLFPYFLFSFPFYYGAESARIKKQYSDSVKVSIRSSDLLLSAQYYRFNGVYLLLLNSFLCYSSRFFSRLIAKQFLRMFTIRNWIVRKLTRHAINIVFRGKLTYQTIWAKINRFSWRVYFLSSLTLSCRFFDDACFSLHFFSDPKWAIDKRWRWIAKQHDIMTHHPEMWLGKIKCLKLLTLSIKT